MQVGGDRFAQRQDADRRGIAVMAVLQRLDRGFDNMVGGAKVRLADPEADDIAAFGGQRGSARQNREGIFLADPVKGGDGLQHDVSPFSF